MPHGVIVSVKSAQVDLGVVSLLMVFTKPAFFKFSFRKAANILSRLLVLIIDCVFPQLFAL